MTTSVYYKNRRDRLLQDRGVSVAQAYEAWVGMRKRVKHPLANKNNGTSYVGLSIDPRWDEFETFLSDMGEPPEGYSIDRIDGTKGYLKENCRWASNSTQVRNRRCTKLNEEAVKAMRFLYGTGKFTLQRLADAHKVSKVLVGLIVRNKIWV
jgi:hypothetical protein